MSHDYQILVALDSSPMSESVFKQALALAVEKPTRLLLLHVLSTEEEGSPLPLPPFLGEPYWGGESEITIETWLEQWESFKSECLEQLRTWAGSANAVGVKAEFRQIPGSPGRVIGQIAKEWGADLIVIGHRGRTGMSEMWLGSVSNYVVHHAPCSVLTVKASSQK